MEVVALYDYTGSTDEELSFSKGDIFYVLNDENFNWWYVRTEQSEQGYVPCTYIEPKDSKRKKQWSSGARIDADGMTIAHKDVRGPKTFEKLSKAHLSGLGLKYYQGYGRLSSCLTPQINASGSGFSDLQYDESTKAARRRAVQCVIGFSVMEAKNVHLDLDPNLSLQGRHVRMALFDGTNILSNIISVSAACSADLESTWRFSSKASLLFPKDDENTCFLRTNQVDLNLCLLFELCIIATEDKNGKAELVELCVGWGLLPLFTSDGGPIENKPYEVKLYGGSAFDSTSHEVQTPTKRGLFRALFGTDNGPKIQIRVWKLGRAVLDEINQLPDTIISFLCAVPVLAMYRSIQAETLSHFHRLGAFFDPALALFPKIASENDMLQFLAIAWERTLRSIGGKKQMSYLKQKFQDCLLLLWPIINSNEFPNYIEGHDKIRFARQAHIAMAQDVGILDVVGKPTSHLSQKPFDVFELVSSFP